MHKIPLLPFTRTNFVFLIVFSVSGIGFFTFFSLTNVSYAQLNGCGEINVGNPPGSVTIPAPCITGGGNQKVVALGEKYIDNPLYLYVWATPDRNWGATKDPTSFDCSGFVGWTWYWGTNGKVSLPGDTSDAWDGAPGNGLQKFLPSQTSQLEPGDLLYFSGGDYPKPGHVGIYIGASKCGASDCFMEFAISGEEGDYKSLADAGAGQFYGFLRPMGQQ
jgi:hypothetical protein